MHSFEYTVVSQIHNKMAMLKRIPPFKISKDIQMLHNRTNNCFNSDDIDVYHVNDINDVSYDVNDVGACFTRHNNFTYVYELYIQHKINK